MLYAVIDQHPGDEWQRLAQQLYFILIEMTAQELAIIVTHLTLVLQFLPRQKGSPHS